MDLLILMVRRRGELVERSEILERLWGTDVFIEADPAVNTLVRKIRQALRDSPDAPKFIETVAGKGYRFIAPLETLAQPEAVPVEIPPDVQSRGKHPDRTVPGVVAVAALLLVSALGWWAWNSRAAPERLRIAVLPFASVSLGADRHYLADALHEETIAALGQSQSERIEVVTRRSTLPYRETSKTPAQLAKELGADYLVECSLHGEQGRIRVVARLIRAKDQAEIWTDSYDDEPRSVLQFQRDLSMRIAQQVRRQLSPERLNALARRHSQDRDAFHLYLQGLDAWNQLKPPQTTERALGFYKRATEADPHYALPWSGLAIAYSAAPINGDADPRVMAREARRTAERAMTADPQLAEALAATGLVRFWFDWDWRDAEAKLRQAIAADPGYAFGRRLLGIVLSHAGRHEEARDHMRRLLALEPTYEMNWALRAQVAFNARQYAEAVEAVRQGSAFVPGFWIADYQLAMAEEQLGRPDSALQTLAPHLATGRANSKLVALQGYILAKTGRRQEALDVLLSLEARASTRYVPPYARALVYAGLGERTVAMDWLERAYADRDVHLSALATDPKWDDYRKNPRFMDLLRRCGFVTAES